MSDGFDKHVFGHQVVAVEVLPGDSTALEYNDSRCKQDGLLLSCFDYPYNEVRDKLLSHNHLMLGLRAIIAKSKWDTHPFCDVQGRLSQSAIGESVTEVLNAGVLVEVLSSQMDEVEPVAATIIAEA